MDVEGKVRQMGIDQMVNDAQNVAGTTALFSIVVNLFSIVFVWYILQEIKLDVFFKFPRSPKARMFQVVLAIVIGHGFASFILDYWNWTKYLQYFVE
ncbi:conserved hypothetical integral membrane protein [Paenibacillus catalpae]|uniref:Conserved hypothetical integral membrane protein n=2 Tax=Paenibacillus catalpae TaxID=1045775 RepID=A0A1I2H3T1_9BACL|nr:conserved hypothetical integral membrane protein [Paenibacillus catalpae]